MSEVRVGIEIDGNHVRGVIVKDDGSCEFEEWTGDSTLEAMRQWSKSTKYKPGPKTTICWSGPTTVRPVDIEQCADHVLPALINDIAGTVVNAKRSAVAGVVSGDVVEGTISRPGLIAAVDLDTINELYKRLPKKTKIVPSAFIATGDGAYLAVRSTSVEMTQVEKGRVNAARTLTIPGVDRVTADIQANPDRTREILEAYTDKIRDEVRNTITGWGRDQRTTSASNVLYIHGVGADAPGLKEKIAEVTGRLVVPPPVNRVRVEMLGTNGARGYQALLGALARFDDQPAIHFSNPLAIAAAAASRTAERKRNQMWVAVATAALCAFVYVWPMVKATRDASNKRSEFQNIAAQIQSQPDADTLAIQAAAAKTTIDSAKAMRIDWDAVLAWWRATFPPDATYNQAAFSYDTLTSRITVSTNFASSPARPPFVSAEEWLARLRELGCVATISAIAEDPDTRTKNAQVTVQLPDLDAFFPGRPPINPPTTTTTPTGVGQ